MAIDEDLQSRQMAVYGRESMGKLSAASVLISGLNGLGLEIAKNVILANVKAVTLHDTKVASMEDLGSQFYLSEKDIGSNRARACTSKLQELNPSVTVTCLEKELSESDVLKFNVVVAVDMPVATSVRLNSVCRENNIAFLRSDIRGLFGYAFADFGTGFKCLDTTGEQPKTGIVASIASDGVVHTVDDERIDFEDGDTVTFSEVEGMDINGKQFQIKVTGPYSFKIGDVSSLGSYSRGGIVTEVKVPKEIEFKSLSAAIREPGEFLFSDFSKFGRSELLHVAFQALEKFQQEYGELPAPSNMDHATKLIALTKTVSSELGHEVEVDEKVVTALSFGARSALSPMAAIFGGMVGQEVVKACTGKFHPLKQWFYLDSLECLPESGFPTDCAPVGCRYDSQIMVFGKAFQEKLAALKYFLVGAGALGCEFLKNFAMMGVGLKDAGGQIFVTDDDTIERSNLSRQFLFRHHDVGQAKSVCASRAATDMNPAFQPSAMQDRVSPDTEEVFNDDFWTSLDGVCNALDNIKARLYVDGKCVLYNKPLLESGTLGTKCNVQVVLPHKTENYGASADPPEKEAPQCTIHHFPHNIDHCLGWSRSEFGGNFENAPADAKLYAQCKTAEEFVESQRTAGAGTEEIVEKLRAIADLTGTGGKACTTFEDCVAWARYKFDEYFNDRILQLLHIYPADSKTRSGLPFWSPPKRFPHAVAFDLNDSSHVYFIVAAANLRAAVCGVKVPAESRNPEFIRGVAAKFPAKQFTPQSNVNIPADEKEAAESSRNPSHDDEARLAEALASVLPPEAVRALHVLPQEFEKDDDTNFHIDFICAAANMRARNYGIGEVDRFHAKIKAGKIVPAIATATALATGFVCLELYKVIQDHKMEQFRNLFANLALPLFAMSEPVGPKATKSRTEQHVPDPLNHPEYVEEEEIIAVPENFTVWDHVDVDVRSMTLQQFVDYARDVLPEKLGRADLCGKVELSSLAFSTPKGGVLAYSGLMPHTKKRLPMPITQVYEECAKQPCGTRKFIAPTCLFSGDMDETIDMPDFRFIIRD
eukprot:Rmarinus@m.19049